MRVLMGEKPAPDDQENAEPHPEQLGSASTGHYASGWRSLFVLKVAMAEIETSRLYLRTPGMQDADEFGQIFAGPDVMEFIGIEAGSR